MNGRMNENVIEATVNEEIVIYERTVMMNGRPSVEGIVIERPLIRENTVTTETSWICFCYLPSHEGMANESIAMSVTTVIIETRLGSYSFRESYPASHETRQGSYCPVR